MNIEKDQPKKRLRIPAWIKKVFFTLLVAIAAKTGLNADAVWATIVDRDVEGEPNSYYIDRTGDGFDDGVISIYPDTPLSSTIRRYMQVGGRVLYEDEGKNDFRVSVNNLIRIEMPDGRVIRIIDIVSSNSVNTFFRHARDYEAAQAAR